MGTDLDLTLAWSGKHRYARERIRPVVLTEQSAKSVRSSNGRSNFIVEGNNLDILASIYSSQRFGLGADSIDLMIWDPPYNTGRAAANGRAHIAAGKGSKFRYNDDFYLGRSEIKEMEDELQKDLIATKANKGDDWDVVAESDPSRHSKWLSFMEVRLREALKLLKQTGIIAIHIDQWEMFRLGVLMDEIFGDQNRVAIINWQKYHSRKNDSNHVSSTTEYILVYAKDLQFAVTGSEARSDAAKASSRNPDGDREKWISRPAHAKKPEPKDRYGIQSPFTGQIHYPGRGAWRSAKSSMKKWLQEWGSTYVEYDLNDGRPPALVLKNIGAITGSVSQDLNEDPVYYAAGMNEKVLKKAQELAHGKYEKGPWPTLFFMKGGMGRPRLKTLESEIRKGMVPMTWWADEDYDAPIKLDSVSWSISNTGHNSLAIQELDQVVGRGHGFDTVKPLSLTKKLIQLWCPPGGVILDAFAGSGTVGQAVIEMNRDTGADRTFIMIERGEGGDRYCDTLTSERVRRVISGKWAVGSREPNPGEGFTYLSSLDERGEPNQVSAESLLKAARSQMIDVILQSLDASGRIRNESIINGNEYLIAKTRRGQGVALVWGDVFTLNNTRLEKIIAESSAEGAVTPVLIYAKHNRARADDEEYRFCRIPDRILAALGAEE